MMIGRMLSSALADLTEAPRRPIVGVIATCVNVLALVMIGSLTLHLGTIVTHARAASVGRIVVAVDRELLGATRAHDEIALLDNLLRHLPAVFAVSRLVVLPYRLETDRTRIGPAELIAGDDVALRECGELHQPSQGVVLGADFAALEKLGPGDAVSLYGNLFYVCAVVPRRYTYMDQAALVSNQAARQLVPQIIPHTASASPGDADAVTAFELRIGNDGTIDDVIAAINRIPHLSAHDPRDQLRLQASALNVLQVVALGTILITLITSFTSIGNAAAASVLERMAEIGLCRAVGARRADIFWEVTTASVLVACAGGVLGLVLAICVSLAMRPVEMALGTFGLFDVNPIVAGGAIVAALLISLISSLGPALRAAALEPAVVLRKT